MPHIETKLYCVHYIEIKSSLIMCSFENICYMWPSSEAWHSSMYLKILHGYDRPWNLCQLWVVILQHSPYRPHA